MSTLTHHVVLNKMKKIPIVILLVFFVPVYTVGAEPGCGDIEDNEEMNYEDDYSTEDENGHPFISAGACTNKNYNLGQSFNLNKFNIFLLLKSYWDCDTPADKNMNHLAVTRVKPINNKCDQCGYSTSAGACCDHNNHLRAWAIKKLGRSVWEASPR